MVAQKFLPEEGNGGATRLEVRMLERVVAHLHDRELEALKAVSGRVEEAGDAGAMSMARLGLRPAMRRHVVVEAAGGGVGVGVEARHE